MVQIIKKEDIMINPLDSYQKTLLLKRLLEAKYPDEIIKIGIQLAKLDNPIKEKKPVKKRIKSGIKQKSKPVAHYKIGKNQTKSRVICTNKRIVTDEEMDIIKDYHPVKTSLRFAKKCGYYENEKVNIIMNHKHGKFLIECYEGVRKGLFGILVIQYLSEL